MTKLTIFDLDGTLLDSLADLATACNWALAQCGYQPHETEAYRFFVGNGVYKLVERTLPEEKRTDDEVLRVKALFDRYYQAHSTDFSKPYDGILTMLDHLHAAGIQVAVASNKPHAFTRMLCETLFVGKIDLAFGQRDSVPKKPNPAVVFEIMNQLKAAPEQCVYVGDSGVDIQTGQNAGLKTIGVLWGFRPKEELVEAGAQVIASNPAQLEKLILKDA